MRNHLESTDWMRKIKLRTARTRMSQEDKKREALEAVLTAQQDHPRQIPQGSKFRPGEGNLNAPVTVLVWSAEELDAILDEDSPVYAHTFNALDMAGFNPNDIWFTSIRKFMYMEPGDVTWDSDAADLIYLDKELDIIGSTTVLACGERTIKPYFGQAANLVTNPYDTTTKRYDSGRITTYIATYSPRQLQTGGHMTAMFQAACRMAFRHSHYVL